MKWTAVPIPVKQVLQKFGSDIKETCVRRHISMDLMAELAGITRPTLVKVEKGDGGTSMGCLRESSVYFGISR